MITQFKTEGSIVKRVGLCGWELTSKHTGNHIRYLDQYETAFIDAAIKATVKAMEGL